jgi:secondary thiamine-phosphate synthase enzyme
MASDSLLTGSEAPTLIAHSRHLHVQTGPRHQFVDLTEMVAETVRRSRVRDGFVCVQTMHTTTAVVVNENEPGLLQDMADVLERLVPPGRGYRHDDLERRPGTPPDEPANGDAHCRAMLLSASQTLTIHAQRIQLGRWQRIFLVELDGGRLRTVSLTVLGTGAGTTEPTA